jgi:hypothetical protein
MPETENSNSEAAAFRFPEEEKRVNAPEADFPQDPPKDGTKFTEESWRKYNIEENQYEKNKKTAKLGKKVSPGFNDAAFVANQAYFKRKAKEQKRDLVDVAEDEARKDNEEFDLKKRSREFNENKEKLEVVKQAMDKKRDLILEGKRKLDQAKEMQEGSEKQRLSEEGQRMIEEASEKRIVLILPGGGLKVSHTFAQTDALMDMGYGPIQIDEAHSVPVINDIYGISTGSMAAGAFMGGARHSKELGNMFFTQHLDSRFINFSASRVLGHILRGETPMVNIGFVEDLLKQDGNIAGSVAFDKQAILDYPGELWFQIARAEDEKDQNGKVIHKAGTAILVNMKEWIKDGGDPARIAKMSMQVPFFAGKNETYKAVGADKEIQVTDGDVALPQMDEIIKNSKPDYVVVMPQVAFKESSTTLGTKIKEKLYHLTPVGDIKKRGFLVKGLVKTGAYENLAKKFSNESGIPTAISYAPESDADTLNKDADPIRMRYNTYRDMCIAWGRPDLVEEYSVKIASAEAEGQQSAAA